MLGHFNILLIHEISDDPDSTFNAVQQQPPNSGIFSIDDQEDTCPALMGNSLPVTTTTTAAPSTEKKGLTSKVVEILNMRKTFSFQQNHFYVFLVLQDSLLNS